MFGFAPIVERVAIFSALASRRVRLKTAFHLVATLFVFANGALLAATSDSVSLAWDPVAQPDVAGYKLYYGTTSGNYLNVMDVGAATTYTVTGLVRGATYFFAVTDYDGQGVESAFSSEVVYQVPSADQIRILSAIALGSSGLRLTWESIAGSVYRITSKTSLTNADWADLSVDIIAAGSTASWVDTTVPDSPYRFYRVRSLYEAPDPL